MAAATLAEPGCDYVIENSHLRLSLLQAVLIAAHMMLAVATFTL
jgi:hypothetical protein